MTHLDALQIRLSHERGYLTAAKTQSERSLRKVWVAQIEKEIEGELAFLGKGADTLPDISDDDLLNELKG